MANPVLNEKAFQAQTDPRSEALAAESATVWNPPITDGPITPYRPRTAEMSMGGVITATGVLLALLLVSAAFGWSLVKEQGTEVTFPGWLFLPMLAGVGVAFLIAFKPHLARIGGIAYALLQGMVVGAISRVYDVQWDGIVLQAVGATMAVFAVVLAMYALRIVRVTNRFRNVVIAATFGLLIFYGVSLLFSLFGAMPSFITSPSLFGIGFSIVAAGIAALNLFLDFDIIERGIKQGAPSYMEWYGAFGLVVTLVWLYLEMLRLLSKLRR
jgi:uncharacterized YccA/Bax inhibitor family protein